MHELLPSAASPYMGPHPYTVTATIGLQMELPRPQLSSGGHCTEYEKDHGLFLQLGLSALPWGRQGTLGGQERTTLQVQMVLCP